MKADGFLHGRGEPGQSLQQAGLPACDSYPAGRSSPRSPQRLENSRAETCSLGAMASDNSGILCQTSPALVSPVIGVCCGFLLFASLSLFLAEGVNFRRYSLLFFGEEVIIENPESS